MLLPQSALTRLIFTHRPPTPLRSTPSRTLPTPGIPRGAMSIYCRVYQVRHEANREVTESRLPPFNAVGWLTPRRSHIATTQTHTPPYSNVPWSWTRRVPRCLCTLLYSNTAYVRKVFLQNNQNQPMRSPLDKYTIRDFTMFLWFCACVARQPSVRPPPTHTPLS